MYRIVWNPDITRDLGGAGFTIILTPKYQEAVAKSKLTQENINALIENVGSFALKGHGYTRDCYRALADIRIDWGSDGISYMQVPGNGCWLSLTKSSFGVFQAQKGDWALESHNIDNLRQASLLLTMFLKIVVYLEIEE